MDDTENPTSLNRRSFIAGTSAVSLATAFGSIGKAAAQSTGDVYARPVHMTYAAEAGKLMTNHTITDIIASFGQVQGGVTCVTPFLLNVKDAGKYAAEITALKNKGIRIIPGIGELPTVPGAVSLNSTYYRDRAKNYAQYFDHVRLDNLQGYVDNFPVQDLKNYIDFLTNDPATKFKTIMLNPWPKDANNNLITFNNPAIQSVFIEVQLKYDHTTYDLQPWANNWKVADTKVAPIRAKAGPNFKILVNYESAPQHKVLAKLEDDGLSSTVGAMSVTVNQVRNYSSKLYWCPPFTATYDPTFYHTWGWIAGQLSTF